MKPKSLPQNEAELFRSQLKNIIDMEHPVVVLSTQINWSSLEQSFGERFRSHRGRPAIPTRLMVGLMIMQHTESLSDDKVVLQWCQNPYWQYFCGMSHFQHKTPIHPSSMSRWRKYIGKEGAEKILSQLIQVAVEEKVISPRDLTQVNVDTTVQEKAITYPTDGNLYCRALLNLVKRAKRIDLNIRQPYTRLAPRLAIKISRYAHAKQYKRMNATLKKLHTRLGRIIREIERQTWEDEKLSNLLLLAKRLYEQQRQDKNKLYSLHAPETECISKGKAHKRYEFGCKVSVVTTNKQGFVLNSQAHHGNPYDGHTFSEVMAQTQAITHRAIKRAFVDKGYRGCAYEGVDVFRSGQGRLSRWFKKQLHARSHVEATIGHMKNEGKLGRNWLKGKEGDHMNALLCGIGQNVRLLLAAISFLPQIVMNLGQLLVQSLRLIAFQMKNNSLQL